MTSLASINATVLSILAAILIALYFYVQTTIQPLSESLNEARFQIAQLMALPPCTKMTRINYEDYIREGRLDLKKIDEELRGLCYPGESTKDSTVERGERLFDLLMLLSVTYPYSERLSKNETGSGWTTSAPKRNPCDQKWKRALTAITQNLLILRPSILAHVEAFEKQDRANNPSDYESDFHIKARGPGFIISPSLAAADFYSRLDFIQSNIIPKINDKAYILDSFHDRFRPKVNITFGLGVSFVILVVGVFCPLFLVLYSEQPVNKSLEFFILALCTFSYLYLLLRFLVSVLRRDFT